MEPACVLRVLSARRVVIGLPSGAVVCAVLSCPIDSDTGRASPTQPVHGRVTLGPYDLTDHAFLGSSFYPEQGFCYEPCTTAYRRIEPSW